MPSRNADRYLKFVAERCYRTDQSLPGYPGRRANRGWLAVGSSPTWGGSSSGGISFCEHLLQRPQRGGKRLCRDHSQFLRQSGLIHRANLIEQNQTLSATMIDTDPKRRLVTRRGHGCDEYCAQMIVHFAR